MLSLAKSDAVCKDSLAEMPVVLVKSTDIQHNTIYLLRLWFNNSPPSEPLPHSFTLMLAQLVDNVRFWGMAGERDHQSSSRTLLDWLNDQTLHRVTPAPILNALHDVCSHGSSDGRTQAFIKITIHSPESHLSVFSSQYNKKKCSCSTMISLLKITQTLKWNTSSCMQMAWL